MVVLPRLVSVKRSEAGTLSRFLDFGLLRFDFFGLRCFGAECCVLIAECFFPGCVREGERLLSVAAILPPIKAIWLGPRSALDTPGAARWVACYFFLGLRDLCGTAPGSPARAV